MIPSSCESPLIPKNSLAWADSSSLSLDSPLFVTWNIKSRSDEEYRLRGCIGNFEALELGEGLKDYAAIR